MTDRDAPDPQESEQPLPTIEAEFTLDHLLLDELGARLEALVAQFDTTEEPIDWLYERIMAEKHLWDRAKAGAITPAEEEQVAAITLLPLVSEPGNHEGLNRPDLIAQYQQNPTLNVLLQKMEQRHASGDEEAARRYRAAFVVMANVVRLQMLRGTYGKHDRTWEIRAMHVGDVHGNVLHMHLGPGIRHRTVHRGTPSDVLPRKDKD